MCVSRAAAAAAVDQRARTGVFTPKSAALSRGQFPRRVTAPASTSCREEHIGHLRRHHPPLSLNSQLVDSRDSAGDCAAPEVHRVAAD